MGIAERREREKQQRQQDIIDAAERIFFSKGIQQATMDDVATEAELSKGTLYLYFKSKDELYLAITLRGIQIMTELFQKAVQKPATGLEKAFAIGTAFFTFAQKYPNYFDALSHFELDELQFDDGCILATECSDVGQGALNILIGALKQGIEDGSIRNDIDPVRMAAIMWGMSSGIIQLTALKGKHLEQEHGFNMEGIVEESFQVFRCALERKAENE
ncbi:TetR/AcrR family transcriptional regulator [bacterium]|nr:TetR/AcrR family transcriptional regulator [bacterium]